MFSTSLALLFEPLLTFEGNNFAGGVHDGAVSGDGAADGIVGIGHVDDDDLGLLAHFLSHADELVRLHGEGAEADVGWVDPQVLELSKKREKKKLNVLAARLSH